MIQTIEDPSPSHPPPDRRDRNGMADEVDLKEAATRLGEDAALVSLLLSFFENADAIRRMTPDAAGGLYRLTISMEKDIDILNEKITE